MPLLRLILIVLCFANAKPVFGIWQLNKKELNPSKLPTWSKADLIDRENGSELPLLKRKYKSKGTQLANLTFVHQKIKIYYPGVELVYEPLQLVLFNKCRRVPTLRGPPILLF